VGRYEEHLKAERAKANIWNGVVMTHEVPEPRDPLTHMSARDEERAWADESARLSVRENIYE
jgi:hypothetical protein